MCGVLLVKSVVPIPLEKHLDAFKILSSRGPDFERYYYNGTIFCGQTVLHITGNNNYYQTSHENFLAYNGEIYNYKDFGSFESDIEFVDYSITTNVKLFKQAWGPWAWVWTDGTKVLYATDPQGEKCLFRYQDENILILCSEVAPILKYINTAKVRLSAAEYQQRHWCITGKTPWQGIERISPGVMYIDQQLHCQIDSIFNWVNPTHYKSLNEAVEDFDYIWQSTIRQMTPECPVALTYSGGLDSSIILQHLDNAELYATNMLGKDPIVDNLQEFLTADELQHLHLLKIDEKQWADAFNQILTRTQMPVQSWSFVGQWIISEHCQERVIFTGTGADELFGGYKSYQNLDFQTDRSTSAYSVNGDQNLWNQCLTVYNNHPGQATLLMDYLYQIISCDARGIDVITGCWGIESRNPFMAMPVVKFALGLPFEFKVGQTEKPIIKKIFTNRWSEQLIKPKKGFSGHCNDSLSWLNVNMTQTGNRDLDWKYIVTESFYNHPIPLSGQTTQA